MSIMPENVDVFGTRRAGLPEAAGAQLAAL
jgi:hypothetical protein